MNIHSEEVKVNRNLTAQEENDIATLLMVRTKKLAYSVAARMKYKDPEELESESNLALALGLRGYIGEPDANSVWQHVSKTIERDLLDFITKEKNHEKMKKTLEGK